MSNLDPNNIPKHVAIIMDGNGRWAKNRGKERVFGHINGVDSVRAAVETAVILSPGLVRAFRAPMLELVPEVD